MKVCIIDTGTANLNSVRQALIRLGVDPVISHDPDVLGSADRLVFPGVGSAEAAMGGVNSRGLGASSSEVPEGSKLEKIDCLGIVPERVLLLDSKGGRLPHMGWNTVTHVDHPLFEGIRQDSYFYFDHSYAMELGPYAIGTTQYGTKFTSALGRGNFMGVQFHPEKSGACGARLLKNFLDNF